MKKIIGTLVTLIAVSAITAYVKMKFFGSVEGTEESTETESPSVEE